MKTFKTGTINKTNKGKLELHYMAGNVFTFANQTQQYSQKNKIEFLQCNKTQNENLRDILCRISIFMSTMKQNTKRKSPGRLMSTLIIIFGKMFLTQCSML